MHLLLFWICKKLSIKCLDCNFGCEGFDAQSWNLQILKVFFDAIRVNFYHTFHVLILKDVI